SPWLPRISAVSNDLDFYDLMVEYVSNLQDAHDGYYIPSDFDADLGFGVDLYDGKVLVDSIDRSVLPVKQFPFEIGDEVVSVDGKSAADLVKIFSKYVSGGNPRTVARLAAQLITDRVQEEYPRAHEIGDTATVVILRQNGTNETYTITWKKYGTPLITLGAGAGPRASLQEELPPQRHSGVPLYWQGLQRLRNLEVQSRFYPLGFDALKPIFTLPAGFTVRL